MINILRYIKRSSNSAFEQTEVARNVAKTDRQLVRLTVDKSFRVLLRTMDDALILMNEPARSSPPDNEQDNS